MSNNNITESVIIIKTAHNNDLPFALKGTHVNIDGQDFVFHTKDGNVYKLPFAAQFAGLSDSSFSVTFTDGNHLSSKDLIAKAIDDINQDTVFPNRNLCENPIHDNHIHEKIITQKIYEKVAVPVHDSVHNPINEQQDPITTYIEKQHSLDDINVNEPPQPIVFATHTSVKALQINNIQDDFPSHPSSIDYLPSLHQLQLETTLKDGTYTVGGGSRDNGGYQEQYGTQSVDFSTHKNDLKIDARICGSDEHQEYLTKIIRLDSITKIINIQYSENSQYHVISWDSVKGIEMGLKPNEFALYYSCNDTGKFNIHVDVVPINPDDKSSLNLGFDIIHDPASLSDSDGYTLLGADPAPLVIKGGSGNDLFIAGRGNDIYDGGEGINTVNYSHYLNGITVDFHADAHNELQTAGLKDSDSAIVSNGSNHQVINDFYNIIGTDYNDTFISNSNNHAFHGGKGNDTFISFGGNNLFDGGEGSNEVNYGNVGGHSFSTVNISPDIDINLNGVDIDLTKNKVLYNGWVDSHGKEGHDDLLNIHTIYGSKFNDLIICDDNNNTIYGVAGDNVIKSGKGNNIIDGGVGHSVIDYSGIIQSVDVDLNTGIITKHGLGYDHITHVHTVIGSLGGGTLRGEDGASNNLIGTAGNTHFIANGGKNELSGGCGDNSYVLNNSVSTVYANGKSNSLSANNNLLTYYGSNSGTDKLNLTAGTATIHCGKGSLDLYFHNTSYNTIYTGHGGNLTYHGGDVFSNLYLDNDTFVTLDYSSIKNVGLNVDLASGVASLADKSGVDTIKSGTINKIIGTQYGCNVLDGESYHSDLSMVAYGNDNKILLGTGHTNSVYLYSGVNGASNDNYVLVGGGKHNVINFNVNALNNVVDYSHTTGVLNIDISQQKAILNGADGIDDYIGVYNIVGNNSENSIFKASDNVHDTTFSISNNLYATIYAVENGNDTYKIHAVTGVQDKYATTVHYDNFSHSLTFNLGKKNIIIEKGNGFDDSYDNMIGLIYGTNHGDTVNILNLYRLATQTTFIGGRGNDTFNFTCTDTHYGSASTRIYGGEGYNTFNLSESAHWTFDRLYFTGSDNRKDGHFSFCQHAAYHGELFYSYDMNKLTLNGSDSLTLYWTDKGYNHIHVENRGTGDSYFYINGGGNYIDGGSKTTLYYNNNTKSNGIIANLETGTIQFNDGRDRDTVKNVFNIAGTDQDDTIIGNSGHANVFYVTKGNDHYDGVSLEGNTLYNNSGCSDIDVGAGTVTKYNGQSTTVSGHDTFEHVQKFEYEGNFSAGSNKIKESDSGKFEFVLNSSSHFRVFCHDGSDNSFISHGANASKDIVFDYSNISGGINSDILDDKTANILKSGTKKDTMSIDHGLHIVGSHNSDVFTIHNLHVLDSMTIDGGGGYDSLFVKSSDDIVNFDNLKQITNIENIDITSKLHKSITFDPSAFFNQHTKQTEMNLTMKNNDYSQFHIIDTRNIWHHSSVDPHTDDYSDGIHTLHVIHSAA